MFFMIQRVKENSTKQLTMKNVLHEGDEAQNDKFKAVQEFQGNQQQKSEA